MFCLATRQVYNTFWAMIFTLGGLGFYQNYSVKWFWFEPYSLALYPIGTVFNCRRKKRSEAPRVCRSVIRDPRATHSCHCSDTATVSGFENWDWNARAVGHCTLGLNSTQVKIGWVRIPKNNLPYNCVTYSSGANLLESAQVNPGIGSRTSCVASGVFLRGGHPHWLWG